MITERLYYAEPYRQSFAAKVLEQTPSNGKYLTILNRTAFYPNAGGQLADTGTLNGIPVTDVYEQDETIVHVTAAPIGETEVEGQIDWPVRFDHMQQHAGQHILSQAFLTRLGGETTSFHMGPEVSSIDLTLTELSETDAAAVEDLANSVVLSGQKIETIWADATQAGELGLRKPPARTGLLRIVNIAGFDRCACGGTHPATTGEVGPIKIRKWEKTRQQIRVSFYCGWRALLDYRWKNELVNRFSNQLTVKDRELGDSLQKIIEAGKEAKSTINLLQSRLCAAAARDLLTSAPTIGPVRVVQDIMNGESLSGLKEIAVHLVAEPSVIALLGSTAAGLPIVFARSENLTPDMGRHLRAVLPLIVGKGGGSPNMAQGGGSRPERLAEALAAALANIREEVSG